ncbi:MAG: hypothetical protein LBS90_05070, partial [Oscillospiraceae bacterium]|nr:hypothetical protein [Oscillospiraceae bacterium]
MPIGQDGYGGAFYGTFDGGGHTVANMIIGGDDYSSGSGSYSEGNGLFGTNYGTIKNVAVKNIEITGYRRSAGIAGYNYGTVAFCSSSTSATGRIYANGGGSDRGTGGIVGTNYGLV